MIKLPDFLQQLRDQLPLSSVVSRHSVIKKKGREYSGLCPFHNEKGASFTVNDEKGFYHCFGCGAHGDHFSFLTQKLNIPFMDAVYQVAEQAGCEVPQFERQDGQGNSFQVDASQKSENERLYALNEAAATWFEQQLRTPAAASVRDYLKRRGMTGDVAKKFRVGYAPDRGLKDYLLSEGYDLQELIKVGLVIVPEEAQRSPYDRFRARVMFPIQDQKGRVVAFGGRILDRGEPKYLNSPDTPLFNKGKLLYAIHHSLPTVRSKKPEGFPFVVVEGYMDVISLHQAGVSSAVAPLGTALTPEQIQLMWRTCPQPVLCFDGDAAGRRAAYRAVERVLGILKPGGYSLNFCFLPEGEDPDSFVQKKSSVAFRELLSQSVSLAEVLWQIFMEQRLLVSPEDKAKARSDLLSLVSTIKDPELQHFYREDLNARLQEKLNSVQESKSWGARNWNPRVVPMQQNLLLNRGPSLVKNKIALGEKILLSILINHPTLVSEVVEQLMVLPFEGQDHLSSIRQILLDFSVQYPEGKSVHLKELIVSSGYESVLMELLSRDLYEQARFAHSSTPVDVVLEGWNEVWQSIQTGQSIKDELKTTSSMVKSTMDEQSWERLKRLKLQST